MPYPGLIQALNDEVHCVYPRLWPAPSGGISSPAILRCSLGARTHKVIDAVLFNTLMVSSLTRDNISVPSYEDTSTPNAGRYLRLSGRGGRGHHRWCEIDFSDYPDYRDDFIKVLNSWCGARITIRHAANVVVKPGRWRIITINL
ncbi:MAG: 7-cyano-7-deazaguanine synthase [Sodalis sp.]|nr:MAG: 7-cyano-7-deazaguanine synthase [Sodalis sp.]